MTPAGDYVNEMPTLHQLDDSAAEAILTGRSVPPELAGLVQKLRETANRPVRPSAELATRMATGDFAGPDGAHRSALHRPQGRGIGAAARAWARAGVRGLAAAPRAFARLRMPLKAGLISAAVIIPIVGLGGAGFAGALPDPVQDRFQDVVESVTPYEFPGRGDQQSGFGHRTSDDARDGGVDGPQVSEEAREQGEQQRPSPPGPPDAEQGGKPSAPPAGPGPPDHVDDPPGQPPITPPGRDGRPGTGGGPPAPPEVP